MARAEVMDQPPSEATREDQVLSAGWRGGVSPFGIENAKLGIWLFLFTDTLTFGSLLAGYGLLRHNLPEWPASPILEIFNLPLVALMTFFLISTSATMAVAINAARRGDQRTVVRFLLLTLLGGVLFLAGQYFEWTSLIFHEGATFASNPWGPPLFMQSFFVITGFHGTHVLVGVIALSIVALQAARGKFTATGVEVMGIYWHFVDLVWGFIFTLFYLI